MERTSVREEKKEAKRLFGAIARFTEIVLDPRGLKTVEMGEAKI